MAVSAAKKAQRARRRAEKKRRDHQAEIINFIEQNIADTEDEGEDNENLHKQIWPVFHSRDHTKPRTGKRKDRFGQPIQRYKQPKLHADPSNKKLQPKPVPKQTLHYRREKAKAAVGKNIGFFDAWKTHNPVVQQNQPITQDDTPHIDLSSGNSNHDAYDSSDTYDSSNDGSTTGDEGFSDLDEQSDDDEPDLDQQDEHQELNFQTDHQQLTLKQKANKNPVSDINQKWEELNNAINNAMDYYNSEKRKDPKLVVPSLILDELREYNSRYKELVLSGSKSPAMKASTLTAQSSCRRLPKQHPQFSSGISRARKIRQQAAYIVIHNKIQTTKAGFASPHPSLIDDTRVFKALQLWAAEKKPGEVCPSCDSKVSP